jgi:hypothetical protein
MWTYRAAEKVGGFYIYNSRGEFSGHATTEAVAKEWVDGINNPPKLTPVSGLRREEMPKRRCGFGAQFVQLTHYYLGNKFLGGIQIKWHGKSTTISTFVGDKGIQGGDLSWMLAQHGLCIQ